jgi:hypothetical protein
MVEFDGGIDVMEALRLEELGMDSTEAVRLLGLERLERNNVDLTKGEKETLEKLRKRRTLLLKKK